MKVERGDLEKIRGLVEPKNEKNIINILNILPDLSLDAMK